VTFSDLENEIRNQVLEGSSFTDVPQAELVSSPTGFEADFLKLKLGPERPSSKHTLVNFV